MDDFTEFTATALNRYFHTLQTLGYMNYENVNKLLVLVQLLELLTDYSEFVTEQDYKDILNAIYCISGNNCMIDFPSYNSYDGSIRKTGLSDRIRMTATLDSTDLKSSEILSGNLLRTQE